MRYHEVRGVSNLIQYIARQAILNRDQTTVGYELLYRRGPENEARFNSPDMASKKTLDSSLLFGLDVLCGDARAYINCTRELLVGDYIFGLPAHKVVLELPVSLLPDRELVESCRKLRSRGYCLAIDNFVTGNSLGELLPLTEILKVDCNVTTPAERAAIVADYGGQFLLVGQKLETHEEFKSALESGFDLFQGYFFCRPELLSIRDISSSTSGYMQMLQAAHDPEIDFNDLEKIIKSDAALCYRLLRYINSALFCAQSGVSSIRHALVLLGEREVRRWIALTAVALVADDKPDELIKTSLVRANFAERLAQSARVQEYHAFLLGLFSVMDAILNLPMETIIRRVEMPAIVAAALSGKNGRLRTLLELIEAYEKQEWKRCEAVAGEFRVDEEFVAGSYCQALVAADRAINTGGSARA